MGFRKEFKAPPLHDREGNVIPFQRPARSPMRITGFAIIAASLCLIAFGVVLRFGVPGIDFGANTASARPLPVANAQDTLSARFTLCSGGQRVNCVVDGDTIWFGGEKIRVLDINTPETSTPQCDQELELGTRATNRLVALLNAGPFSLERGADDTDQYGRKLRRITRGGQSIGDVLVAEGLAERWKGYRGSWC